MLKVAAAISPYYPLTPEAEKIGRRRARDGHPNSIKVTTRRTRPKEGKEKGKEGNLYARHPALADMDIPVSVFIAALLSPASANGKKNHREKRGKRVGMATSSCCASVEKVIRSEKAGFHAGDVIVKVKKEEGKEKEEGERRKGSPPLRNAAVTVCAT